MDVDNFESPNAHLKYFSGLFSKFGLRIRYNYSPEASGYGK